VGEGEEVGEEVKTREGGWGGVWVDGEGLGEGEGGVGDLKR